MRVIIDPPPQQQIAPMDKPIAVGFGEAYVTKDGKEIYNELDVEEDGLWTFQDAENYALQDPSHTYKVVLYAPLHGETYERKGVGEWVLVESNNGFA